MLNPLRYKYSMLYLAIIPLVNWVFSQSWHFFALPDGNLWSPFSIIVGLALVVRDFAQHELGQLIFVPLGIGVALSYILATPQIATASAVAFLVSELSDWAVFTFSKKPLSQRVLISSAIGAPIDTFVFLYGASFAFPHIFSIWTFTTMIASKMIGAVIVWWIMRKRENSEKASTTSF